MASGGLNGFLSISCDRHLVPRANFIKLRTVVLLLSFGNLCKFGLGLVALVKPSLQIQARISEIHHVGGRVIQNHFDGSLPTSNLLQNRTHTSGSHHLCAVSA